LNPDISRWIDRNIGPPICFILTLHRRFADLFKRRSFVYSKPAKILFIKFVEQGSIVLAYPAIKRAEELVGRENLYFLTFTESRPILDVLDVIPSHNVIEVSSSGLFVFVLSVLRALLRIRREHIDTAIDMEFFSRVSAIISYLCGAKKRAGLHRFTLEGLYRGDLFTHKLAYNPYLHTKVLFLSFVEALTHEPFLKNVPMVFEVPKITTDFPRFLATENEKEALIDKIQKLRQSPLEKPIVVLNPKISDLLPIRRWPQGNFIKLAKLLIDDYPRSSIIITGSVREKKESNIMASQIPKAVSLAGHINLRELLVLYCLADVLVTTDSGPAHFSTLTSVKSVVIFGPETPILYGHYNDREEIIAPSLVCSPCINVYNQRKSFCEVSLCLSNVKAEDVYQKVKTLLQK